MISQNCDFEEFIEAIKSQDHMEIVYLAEQEATQAERFMFRSQSDPEEIQKCAKEYSALLKKFIQYIKYDVKPKLPAGHEYQAFAAISENLQAKTQKLP